MKHILNGLEIAPRNIDDIGVISNFGDIPTELELNVDKIIVPREGYNLIKSHINTLGLFEGIPYEIVMNNGTSLQYYVDLTEETLYREHEVEVKIKRRKGKDNFLDRADGSSFEMLKKNGVNFNIIDIPYLIISDNQAELFFHLAITSYIMTKELIYAADQVVQAITEIIAATTPDIGLAGPTVQTGDIINMALKIAARIVYFAAVIIAVITLGKDLVKLIFPKVRYLKGCSVKDLVEKGCQYLGYNVQSQLLNDIENYHILPVPLMSNKSQKWYENLVDDLNTDFNKGYPTAQDTTPNLGNLIRSIETMFNAKTRVYNGTVYIERRDFWQNLSQNAINPALNIQADRDNVFKYNTEDIWKRYYIHYQVDFSDTHTTDDFDSTDAEFSCEAVTVVNQDLVNIKGLNDVNVNFALGKRKDKLNFIEAAAADILSNIDLVVSVFGGNSNVQSLITNRIGVLQISQQFFSVTKLLYLIGTKQPSNYKNFVRASYLWDKYHYINQIQLNNYKIIENVRVRLSDTDFVNLQINNFAQIGNQVVEILKIEYIDDKSYALITYRDFNNYAQGKVNTLTINS
jgi:hypothetical protein|tara:strand:- start:11756 stop:13477 length:1722 start_codon:yes stop_codon:yes gene_type:complete